MLKSEDPFQAIKDKQKKEEVLGKVNKYMKEKIKVQKEQTILIQNV